MLCLSPSATVGQSHMEKRTGSALALARWDRCLETLPWVLWWLLWWPCRGGNPLRMSRPAAQRRMRWASQDRSGTRV